MRRNVAHWGRGGQWLMMFNTLRRASRPAGHLDAVSTGSRAMRFQPAAVLRLRLTSFMYWT